MKAAIDIACSAQVRRRDLHTKKVVVEECRYDNIQSGSSEGAPGSSKPDEGFVSEASQRSSSPGFSSSFAEDPHDQYAWVNRMQHIPDKDALQELAQLGYMPFKTAHTPWRDPTLRGFFVSLFPPSGQLPGQPALRLLRVPRPVQDLPSK